MAFKLQDLSYSYTALEPHIDARTMEIHHTKHHAGYTNNLNNAISGTALENKSIEEILKGISGHSVAVHREDHKNRKETIRMHKTKKLGLWKISAKH